MNESILLHQKGGFKVLVPASHIVAGDVRNENRERRGGNAWVEIAGNSSGDCQIIVTETLDEIVAMVRASIGIVEKA